MSAEDRLLAKRESAEQIDAVQLFLTCWDVETVAKRKVWSMDETLDFLGTPESQSIIDARSAKVTAIYSRMPKEFYLQTIMGKIAKITDESKATEIKTYLDGFMNWHKEAPPPSNREFAEQLMEQLK